MSKHLEVARDQGAQAGFDAYCASPGVRGNSPMTAAARIAIFGGNGEVKTTKKAFAAYCRKFGLKAKAAPTEAPAVTTTPDIMAQFAAFLRQRGVEVEGTNVVEAIPVQYREKLATAEWPENRASNQMLARLNVEGLLSAAVERSEGAYVTRDVAQAILTETFGPLEARA